MLRMTIKAQSAQELILGVYGKVTGAAIPLLQQEVENRLGTSAKLVLDLDGVPFIDRSGLEVLKQWSSSKVDLRGGSPFLRALLAAEGLEIH